MRKPESEKPKSIDERHQSFAATDECRVCPMKRIAIVESNDTARIFTPRGELRFTAIANRRRHAPASDQPHSNQAELVVYPAENRQSTNAGMFAPHCHLLT